MIRLIALDLDGTLLDPAGRITQASKDAIARARAAGVRVVLNTGRPIQEAVWFAGEAGCDALLSCLGGAAVVDGVRGETLRRWDMPEESGRRALELCLGREIELMIFAGEEIVVDPFSKESLSRTYPFPIFHSAAVGDSDNDLSMLRAAGLPIAMGNAPAAVREAARRTAPSNQEEGVAWAISRCLEENEWERGEKG